jgi:hypothetical protein
MDIVEKIERLIGERQKAKKRKRKEKEEYERRKRQWGTMEPDKKAQKKYVGHGSIKDLMK